MVSAASQQDAVSDAHFVRIHIQLRGVGEGEGLQDQVYQQGDVARQPQASGSHGQLICEGLQARVTGGVL